MDKIRYRTAYKCPDCQSKLTKQEAYDLFCIYCGYDFRGLDRDEMAYAQKCEVKGTRLQDTDIYQPILVDID